MVIRVILEEFRRLRDDVVQAKELQKSKDHLVGSLILNLETSDELASFYGGQEVLTRSLLQPKDLIARIQNVEAAEVRNVARELFKETKLNLAVIGPYKKSAAFRKILKF
jgi:predicted Zn-dependent peptidase